MRCTWHLQVPRGFRIKVRFRRQFDIEKSPGCSKDHVMLSTTKQFRNPLIYCGNVRPHGIITPLNSVWIRFHSDNTTNGRGFYISFTSIGKLSYFLPRTFSFACKGRLWELLYGFKTQLNETAVKHIYSSFHEFQLSSMRRIKKETVLGIDHKPVWSTVKRIKFLHAHWMSHRFIIYYNSVQFKLGVFPFHPSSTASMRKNKTIFDRISGFLLSFKLS